MSIFRIIVLDIVIFVLSFYVASSVYLLIKHFRAVIPITNTMIEHQVIKPNMKGQLLLVNFLSCVLSFAVLSVFLFVALLFTNHSGYIVLATGLFFGLVVLKPTKDRYTVSQYTIDMYAKRHYVCMDMDKFTEIMETKQISFGDDNHKSGNSNIKMHATPIRKVEYEALRDESYINSITDNGNWISYEEAAKFYDVITANSLYGKSESLSVFDDFANELMEKNAMEAGMKIGLFCALLNDNGVISETEMNALNDKYTLLCVDKMMKSK